VLAEEEPDFVCLAGYMRCSLPAFMRAYHRRILNIHLRCFPRFTASSAGAGGSHGVKVSGCTVHFVDENLDAGPIIMQPRCRFGDDDTAITGRANSGTGAHRVCRYADNAANAPSGASKVAAWSSSNFSASERPELSSTTAASPRWPRPLPEPCLICFPFWLTHPPDLLVRRAPAQPPENGVSDVPDASFLPRCQCGDVGGCCAGTLRLRLSPAVAFRSLPSRPRARVRVKA